MIQLYKVLSFVIMLIALLLSFMVIAGLFIALANPVLLLNVFILGAVVIYSFTSFSFLQKGLIRKQKVKSKLKDWIKVNAYVAITFVTLVFFQTISIVMSPTVLKTVIDQFQSLQTAQTSIPKGQLFQLMQIVMYAMLIYALMLGTHIAITFRLIKQHSDLFDDTISQND